MTHERAILDVNGFYSIIVLSLVTSLVGVFLCNKFCFDVLIVVYFSDQKGKEEVDGISVANLEVLEKLKQNQRQSYLKVQIVSLIHSPKGM